MFARLGRAQDGSSSKAMNVFSEDDIGEVLGSFKLGASAEGSPDSNLILSSSNTELVRRDELILQIKDYISKCIP
jgi:hypothetical protein